MDPSDRATPKKKKRKPLTNEPQTPNRTQGSREQLAIAEFAESLLIIPKTLAVNAACDSTDLVARLRAYHNTAQTDPSKKSYAE
jgi:chaperonin GroEL (HSP60 family)